MASSTSSSDLPAASGLTGHTTSLPVPGEYPYLDAETQVPIIIGVSAALLVISSIVVVLRLYTRYWLIKVAGDDDITIGLAQVGLRRWRTMTSCVPAADKYTICLQLLNVGLAIITILRKHISERVILWERKKRSGELICLSESTHGLGRHTWMVSQSDKIRQLEVGQPGDNDQSVEKPLHLY